PSPFSCSTSSATTLLRSTMAPWESGRGILRCRSKRTDPEASMTATDIKGLGVSTTSVDTLTADERGLDLFLRWRAGSLEALDAAAQSDPRFALAHCTKAYIAWRMGRADLATAAGRQGTAAAGEGRHEAARLHRVAGV